MQMICIAPGAWIPTSIIKLIDVGVKEVMADSKSVDSREFDKAAGIQQGYTIRLHTNADTFYELVYGNQKKRDMMLSVILKHISEKMALINCVFLANQYETMLNEKKVDA